MRKICAWCNKKLETPVSSDGTDLPIITHGICSQCAESFFLDPGESLEEFVDSLNIPVLVLEASQRVLTANRKARSMLGESIAQLHMPMIGSALTCVNARQPGGCGKQSACQVCKIRATLLDTAETGRSHARVQAWRNLTSPSDETATKLTISTEKIGFYLLLRIDSMEIPSS